MSRMIVDFETFELVDMDEVSFYDELQMISYTRNGQDGFPHSTLEVIEDKKEYFKRKLKGK